MTLKFKQKKAMSVKRFSNVSCLNIPKINFIFLNL